MHIIKNKTNGFLKTKHFSIFILSLALIHMTGINYVFADQYSQENNFHNQHNPKQQIKAEKNKRAIITLDFYGGYAFLNPSDLNTAAQYQEKYYNWYYGDYYRNLSSIYSNYFRFTESKEGEFQKIKNALPFGLRIKWHATPRLAFSLGFQYITREETSNIVSQYEVYSAIPDMSHFVDDFTQTIKLSPLSISVKGYIPLLGAHYMIPLSPSLSLETFFTGGLLITRSQYLMTETDKKMNQYEYWQEYTRGYDYKGKGTGYSFGGGVRAEWLAVRDIGLFVECGYSLQKAGKIHGSASYDYCIEYSNAPKIGEPTKSWTGYWGLYSIERDENYFDRGVAFSAKYLYPIYNKKDPAVDDFHLDLSGFQFRIGLSFHFR